MGISALRAGACRLWVAAAVLIVAAVLVAPGARGAQSAPNPHITVRPAAGTRQTRFVVRFTAERTGRVDSTEKHYEVGATGGTAGCSSGQGDALAATRQGQRVRVVLTPPGPAGWCKGRYAGRVRELIRPVCGYRNPCPLFIAVRTVGKFTFLVR
jgi:hypothetical protein